MENVEDLFDIKDELILQIIQLIQADYHRPWDVESICKELEKSRSQVFRRVKSLSGYSTTIFIRRIRLSKSHELLIDTNKTVSEIAFEVGFENLSYFSRCFTEVYHKSPSELRKNR